MSHTTKVGQGEYADLIDQLADLALKKFDPDRAQTKRDLNANQPCYQGDNRSASPSRNAQPTVKLKTTSKNPRYIPAAMRRAVWKKSQYQCRYQNPVTKIKCGARKYLEIDHIKPVAKGGASTLENLQLLYDAHNRWKGTAAN